MKTKQLHDNMTYIVLGGIIFCLCLLLIFYDNSDSLYRRLYKTGVALYSIFTVCIFSKKYIIHFLYLIVDEMNPNWIRKRDRPQLTILCISAYLMYQSYSTMSKTAIDITDYTITITFFILSVILLILMESKRLETWLIPKVAEILTYKNIYPCRIAKKEAEIRSIYNGLNGKELTCDLAVFQKLIRLEAIYEHERIIWHTTKVDLIRFLFVIYDIPSNPKTQIQHAPIREIIKRYFVDENNQEIELTLKGSEIAERKNEKQNKLNPYYNAIESRITSLINS